MTIRNLQAARNSLRRAKVPQTHGAKIALAVRTLWRTVLAETLKDYRSGRERWSYFFSEDFISVCRMADINPEVARAQARTLVHTKGAAA